MRDLIPLFDIAYPLDIRLVRIAHMLALVVQKGYYVWSRTQLLSLNPANVDYLLGEFCI